MKMIYVSFNVSVFPALNEILTRHDVQDYQLFDHVKSYNRRGVPRLNTPVWPGYNNVVYMPVRNDGKAEAIMSDLKAYNSNVLNEDELMTASIWTLQDYIFE